MSLKDIFYVLFAFAAIIVVICYWKIPQVLFLVMWLFMVLTGVYLFLDTNLKWFDKKIL